MNPFDEAASRNKAAQDALDSVQAAKSRAAKLNPGADRFAATARAVAKTGTAPWTKSADDVFGANVGPNANAKRTS